MIRKLNFKGAAVTIKPKSDYRNGKTVYKNDKWYAKVNDKEYIIVNSEDNLHLANVLYSKPANNKQKNWTEWYNKTNSLLTNIDISKYWSKFKPDMKIKGYIIDNEFKII